jgi:hypothetical protein
MIKGSMESSEDARKRKMLPREEANEYVAGNEFYVV